jgi:hypothetical protein
LNSSAGIKDGKSIVDSKEGGLDPEPTPRLSPESVERVGGGEVNDAGKLGTFGMENSTPKTSLNI